MKKTEPDDPLGHHHRHPLLPPPSFRQLPPDVTPTTSTRNGLSCRRTRTHHRPENDTKLLTPWGRNIVRKIHRTPIKPKEPTKTRNPRSRRTPDLRFPQCPPRLSFGSRPLPDRSKKTHSSGARESTNMEKAIGNSPSTASTELTTTSLATE